jgi:hypothetical protein
MDACAGKKLRQDEGLQVSKTDQHGIGAIGGQVVDAVKFADARAGEAERM